MAKLTSLNRFYVSSIREISDFVCKGARTSPFIESIILQDRDGAINTLQNANIDNAQCVDVLLEWTSNRVPPNLFSSREDIEVWIEHEGIKGAPDEKRFFSKLFMEWAEALVDDQDEMTKETVE